MDTGVIQAPIGDVHVTKSALPPLLAQTGVAIDAVFALSVQAFVAKAAVIHICVAKVSAPSGFAFAAECIARILARTMVTWIVFALVHQVHITIFAAPIRITNAVITLCGVATDAMCAPMVHTAIDGVCVT